MLAIGIERELDSQYKVIHAYGKLYEKIVALEPDDLGVSSVNVGESVNRFRT